MEHISKAQVKLIRSLQQKKYRDESGLFVAEGEKCVDELRKSFELVYRIQSTDLPTERTGTLLASPTEIEQMSSLRTPQGVIGVFRKARRDGTAATKEHLLLALDGIQDPGNLGTIIRTCDWFGVHDVFCSADTADCYNPKVVQATMGALARVRVHYVNLPEWLKEYSAQGTPVYGTLLEGRNMYEVLNGRQPAADSLSVIVMGNEGNGISQAVRSLVSHPILIPSYPPKGTSGQNEEAPEVIESLNVSVATAIVLAEFRRSPA